MRSVVGRSCGDLVFSSRHFFLQIQFCGRLWNHCVRIPQSLTVASAQNKLEN